MFTTRNTCAAGPGRAATGCLQKSNHSLAEKQTLVGTLSKFCVFITVSMSVLRPPTGWLAVSAPWPGLCLALLRATSEKRELLVQAGIDFGKNLTGY